MQPYIAHVDQKSGRTQSMTEHAENVAELSARFAAPLCLAQTARLIALVHDMGKGTPPFQAYLAEDEKKKTHFHAPAGAIFAYERWFSGDETRRRAAQIIALCVYGHHTGLMDCVSKRSEPSFLQKMQLDKHELHYNEAVAYFTENVASLPKLDALFADACKELNQFRAKGKIGAFYDGLTARLLLSMLVDADRYDAACFEYGEDPFAQPPEPAWDELLRRLDAYTKARFAIKTPIDQIRAKIATRCGEAAARMPGVYRLTVPTGGGKTLSSLRFALGHAARHGMARIFYVIPFNTILDQNARDIRAALGGYGSILEHHANVVVEDEGERMQYRRLTERWDSHMILTSMVQFLNALYRCENTNARRMHRLMRSVIVFDEIQALPSKCRVLFERAVNFLVRNCGCTVLLCTATQMEFANLVMPDDNELMGDEKELAQLYDVLARVRWIPELSTSLTNEDAARKLQNLMCLQGSVLVVVNTKAVAWEVYRHTVDLLKEQGVRPVAIDCTLDREAVIRQAKAAEADDVLCIHLSTLLCPKHRLAYIDFMKAWLEGGGRALCVSTTLIEAGINISFPAVVRSLAGIPSIVQAGGRCNRNMERESGNVYIWEFQEEALKNLAEIENGKSCTRKLYHEAPENFEALCKPSGIYRYFGEEQSYTKKAEKYPCENGNLVDLLSVNKAFANGTKNLFPLKQAFRTAGETFRVIDEDTRAVIVPYGEGAAIINALLSQSEIKQRTLLLARAQQYSVNVYDSMMKRLEEEGAVYAVGDTGVMALKAEYYDAERGLPAEGREIHPMIV